MKRLALSAPKILTALVIFAGFVSMDAFATNGSYFIGTTPASQAMGGTGVAYYTSDGNAIYKNPAMLTLGDHKGNGQAELSVNYLNLSVNGQAVGSAASSSSATPPLAPNFSGSYRLNPKWALGLGFFTMGGAASNFAGNAGFSQIESNYQSTRIMPAIAYAPFKNFSIGIAPFLTWGKLAVNYADPTTPSGAQSTRGTDGELGTGFQVGMAFAPMDSLTFGLNYSSRSRVQYKSILDYGKFSSSDLYAGTGLQNFIIEEPQQIAAGVDYEILSGLNVTFDWRWIGWHASSGSRDIGWDNQNVFALGAEEKYQQWHFRAGYNYGKAPVSSTAGDSGSVFVQGTNQIDRSSQSIFAAAAFPAFTSSHYTLGAGYEFSDAWKADVSFVYAPSAGITRAGNANLTSTAYSYNVNASQFDVALGGSYSF